jgi:hypothetical protein
MVQHTKTGKIYQITIKYTKWPQNIPTNHKIDQMDIKKYLPLQDPKNLPKSGLLF